MSSGSCSFKVVNTMPVPAHSVYLRIKELRKSSLLILVANSLYMTRRCRYMIIPVESESSQCARYGILLEDQLPWPVTFNIIHRQVVCYSYTTTNRPRQRAGLTLHKFFPRSQHPHIWRPSAETCQYRGKTDAATQAVQKVLTYCGSLHYLWDHR